MTNPSPPFRPSGPAITKNLGHRLRRLERGDVGLWHYVRDPAPFTGYNTWGIPNSPGGLIPGGVSNANIPPDCAPMEQHSGDPDTVSFQNHWTNVATADGTYHPMAFRMHAATQLQLTGVIGLGLLGATVITLPTWAIPRFNIRVVMGGVDDTTRFMVTVSALTGNVVVVGEI